MSWITPLLSIIDRLLTYRSAEKMRLRVIALKSHRRDALARYTSYVRESQAERKAGNVGTAKGLERKAIAESTTTRSLTSRILRLETRIDENL